MQPPGLDNRHRDKNGEISRKHGEISRKHGNTLIRTLRETYGPGFAPGCDPDAKLSDCLHMIDEKSCPSWSTIVAEIGSTIRSAVVSVHRRGGIAIPTKLLVMGDLI
jgi:hypothetical protein